MTRREADSLPATVGWLPGLLGNGAPCVRPVVCGLALYSGGIWHPVGPQKVYPTVEAAREAALRGN